MSSSVEANRRLRELELILPPCRPGFGLSLASMQQVSNQCLLDLGLADWHVPFQSWFCSLGLKFFLLLCGVPAEPIGAVPPFFGRPFPPKSGLSDPITATSRSLSILRTSASTSRRLHLRKGNRAPSTRSPINSVCPNGLVNSGFESENSRHPFDCELCQFGDSPESFGGVAVMATRWVIDDESKPMFF